MKTWTEMTYNQTRRIAREQLPRALKKKEQLAYLKVPKEILEHQEQVIVDLSVAILTGRHPNA